jgi:hypothetical protein
MSFALVVIPNPSGGGCRAYQASELRRMGRRSRDYDAVDDPKVSAATRREQSFVTRGLVMHWPSVLASANRLREGQRFVRPFRKDAGRHLCGRRNGVF